MSFSAIFWRSLISASCLALVACNSPAPAPKDTVVNLGTINKADKAANLDSTQEVDWYKFKVEEDGYYYITTNGDARTQGNIALSKQDSCDSTGSNNTTMGNPNGDNHLYTLRELGANSEYYVCVTSKDNSTGSYDLSIKPNTVHPMTAHINSAITYLDNTVYFNSILFQQTDGGALDWPAANDYCEDLTLGEFNEWALPVLEHLQHIGETYIAGSADYITFTQNDALNWTANKIDNNYATAVQFNTGESTARTLNTALITRCELRTNRYNVTLF